MIDMTYEQAFWIWVVVVLIVLLLPDRFDPAMRIKMRQIREGRHPESPSCFGSKLGPQGRAEHDCFHCVCVNHCPSGLKTKESNNGK